MIKDVDIVIARARSMIGTPFMHLGRGEFSVDCVGLLVYAFDYDSTDVPAYSRDPFNNELETHLERILGPACLVAPSIDELRPGDVVSMQYRGPVRHVGLIADYQPIAGELSLIHTDSSVGEVIEHRLNFKWVRRISKVFRV